MTNRLGELNTHLPKEKHILSQNGNDMKLYDAYNFKTSLSSNLAKIMFHHNSSSRPNNNNNNNNNNN